MKTYGEEYKREALALEIGVRAASRKLGVCEKTLYGWRKAAAPAIQDERNESAEAKVRRLEKEVDELRRANEILKKAMGFLVR